MTQSNTGEQEAIMPVPDEGTDMISEQEARDFQPLLRQFLSDYANKPEHISDQVWLTETYARELSVTKTVAEELSNETLSDIHRFEDHMASLQDSHRRGINKEAWLANQMEAAAVGQSIGEYGNFLSNIDVTISRANAQMYRTIVTQQGGVSQNMNLDGFLAEQHHVNSFNLNAALEKSPYQAKVCVPDAGQTYGKDSFDVVIQEKNHGAIVHQYQFKYGKTAAHTIQMLRQGDYHNQQIVVPENQVEAVRKAFPTKTIVGHIGGTERVAVQSSSLSKENAKRMQEEAQQYKKIETVSWNSYNTRALALGLGKTAVFSGMSCAAISIGFDLAKRAATGEKFDKEESIRIAIATGADSGIKAATTAALKVGSQRGLLTLLPKGTPLCAITSTACMGVEGVKALYKVAKGEMTPTEALDHMGRTGCAVYGGLMFGLEGAAIGAVALSIIPIAGPIVGGLIGGMIGYAAGSKIGSMVYDTAKKTGEIAKNVLKSTWDGIKSTAKTIYNGAKSVANTVSNMVSSGISAIRNLF